MTRQHGGIGHEQLILQGLPIRGGAFLLQFSLQCYKMGSWRAETAVSLTDCFSVQEMVILLFSLAKSWYCECFERQKMNK